MPPGQVALCAPNSVAFYIVNGGPHGAAAATLSYWQRNPSLPASRNHAPGISIRRPSPAGCAASSDNAALRPRSSTPARQAWRMEGVKRVGGTQTACPAPDAPLPGGCYCILTQQWRRPISNVRCLCAGNGHTGAPVPTPALPCGGFPASGAKHPCIQPGLNAAGWQTEVRPAARPCSFTPSSISTKAVVLPVK